MKTSTVFLILLAIACSTANNNLKAQNAENIVLITLDGLRWQELFWGIDHALAESDDYSSQSERLINEFSKGSRLDSARTLMPFMHNVLFDSGMYVGNVSQNSCAQVTNDWYFSYPGYSEILTGIVNPAINSNAKIPNPEMTFLELLNHRPDFFGETAAFASWDVFPFIFNAARSEIHINAFNAIENPQNEFEENLNTLMNDTPTPWATVRNDSFTHHYAMSYIKREKPKVLFISYGETDDFAHDGKYDEYLFAAHRTDRFISEIWQLLQSMPNYKDNTVLFVTVDHGRGSVPMDTWKHHASKTSVSGYMSSLAQYEEGIVGSDSVWMAAMGPGVPDLGLITTGENCLTSNRIAATLLELIAVDYQDLNSEMGKPMQEFIR